MIAPNSLPAPPLTQSEERAIAEMYARERAIAASEPNRRAHALVRAARELLIRVNLFVDEVPRDAGVAVLKEAGLDDPDERYVFGSEVFGTIAEKAAELSEALDDFIGIAGNDLPEPPPPRAERSES